MVVGLPHIHVSINLHLSDGSGSILLEYRIFHLLFGIGSISVEMPTMGTRIRVINRDGTIGSSEVRDLGIEMATNEKSIILHSA